MKNIKTKWDERLQQFIRADGLLKFHNELKTLKKNKAKRLLYKRQ